MTGISGINSGAGAVQQSVKRNNDNYTSSQNDFVWYEEYDPSEIVPEEDFHHDIPFIAKAGMCLLAAAVLIAGGKTDEEKAVMAAKMQKEIDKKKIADTAEDDENYYYTLHLSKSDSPYIERHGSDLKISAENFKKMFDIEDFALRHANPAKPEFRRWDCTEARLNDGDTYIVPKYCIKTGNDINLEDYLE